MTAPTVSVVVPAHDAEQTIGRCVESLQAQQTTAVVELIVVDDGSGDRTAAVAEQAGATVVRRPRAGGAAAARNSGIDVAGGGIVAFTDADCVVHPEWLERLIAPLADPGVAIACGEVLALDDRPAASRYGEVIHDTRAAIEVYRPPYAIGSNWASRRGVLVALAGFDEALRRGQDVDLSYTALEAGYRIAHAPGAIVRHRNERRASELLRLGIRHGFASRIVEAKHRELLRGHGHDPVRSPRWSVIGAHLTATLRGPDRSEELCAAVFKAGKKLGMAVGRARFRRRRASPDARTRRA